MKNLVALVSLATCLSLQAGAVAVWGQCGGTGFTGSTVCDAGSSCVFENPYYSQCQPSTATTSSPATSTPPSGGSGGSGLNAHFKAKGKIY
ncbi:CBM1 domain-containing protein [Phanerochaete sordida]|uniref:CBM1 domain-containing protein n=1 Tax=Phanerochaete sordida TaxID=48140 RepID=A0A9P3GG94_9APHY|nr:CBM1 domain-containing protein [Phanerochaete sordida]